MNTLISVLLPTYNERENLPLVVAMLVDVFESNEISWEIVIIDDSSPDGTWEVAQQLAKNYGPRIRLVKREGKLGLGNAYARGCKEASGEFVLIMDADLSHSPRYIPAMLRKQKKYSLDIVVGSRYHSGNSRCGVYGWSFGRKLTSTVANCLASFVLGLPASATDVTGSFRLYKRPILVQLIEECSTGGYAFQMEVLVRAYKHEMLIGEVPIVFVDRLYGNSKLNSGEIFKYLQGIGKLFVELP